MSAQYVVDTSVIIQYLITETYTPHTRVLIAQLAQNVEINVPEICIVECTNVLWKQVRFQGMPRLLAEQLVVDLGILPLQIIAMSSLLPRALAVGLSYQLAVYDSLYIALAESLNCPLITVDQRQAQAASAAGVTLKPITDFSPI
jgi:predicted nucleic acid-binding protein